MECKKERGKMEMTERSKTKGKNKEKWYRQEYGRKKMDDGRIWWCKTKKKGTKLKSSKNGRERDR